MLRIAAKKLSQGTQGPDVAQVHSALAELGKTVASSERAKRVYGPTTAEAIRASQEELGIPATGVVDEATVRVINKSLGTRKAEERVVRGTVRLATGAPPPGGLVARVLHKDRDRELPLAEKDLDQDGLFEVPYKLSPEAQKRSQVDLRVEIVARGSNTPLATRPDGHSILQDADLLEVVNFVVLEPDRLPQSEYDQINGDLKEILGDPARLDRMDGEQLHLLAEDSSYPVGHLASYATARRLAQETKLPEPLLYGLVRSGLPSDRGALLAASPSVISAAIDTAVKNKVVPEKLADGRTVAEAVRDLPKRAADFASLAPRPGIPSLRDLTRLVLTDAEADDLIGRYVAAPSAEAFWSGIANHPKAKEFRLVADLGALTNNHVPLVKAIRDQQIKDLPELAALPMTQWDQLLTQAGTPADTPGATAAEKSSNYRKAVLDRLEGAFFRPFLASRLQEAGAPAPVVQFLQTQTAFDPKTTHLEGYLKKRPGATISDSAKLELKAYQRLVKLTGNSADTIAIKPHAASAHEIVAMGRKAFTAKVPSLGEARAREIFERAEQANAAALALWSEHAASLNRTGMPALPRLDQEALKKAAVGDDQQPGPIPDWETLFGSFDLCACEHCNSVHGPAAHFVDLLEFLKSREVLDRLLARRPDLAEIELSCENTNTVLPYIDLVNEILEDQIAPPAPFAEQTLPGISLDDFAGTSATDALRNAFAPPLGAGASVELLEERKRWRVLDEHFAYGVEFDGSVFKALTRSRQTTGSAEVRKAYPQYRNAAAYDELNEAFFPWTLPFDQNAEEAFVFLKHLGIARRDLIEALRAPAPHRAPGPPIRVRLACERLGLTDQEHKVLVGEIAVDRAAFWGSGPTDSVQDILDGSWLRFADLDLIVATWFVNPNGNLRIEPPGTCDTIVLRIAGLGDAELSRLHRFVRLWRKLNWNIEYLDKVLRTLSPDFSTPTLNDEMLVSIAHIVELSQWLKLPVLEVLAFWSVIDTAGLNSLYGRLFQDEKFPKAVRESFRLPLDQSPLLNHAATLQAILRLSGPYLVQLVALTNGQTLTLENLSILLRHARLMQALRLSPDELATAQALTGLNPFENPEVTVRFVIIARAVADSGFRWDELDYLLRHRFQAPAAFVPSDESLAAALTDLRTALLPLGPDVADVARREVVLDWLAKALSVPEALADHLLSVEVMVTLVGTREIGITKEPDGTEVLSPIDRQNAALQLEFLQKALKIAHVANRLALPGVHYERLVGSGAWVDLEGLSPSMASPLAFDAWYRLVQFIRLRRDLGVSDAAFEALLTGQHAVAVAGNDADRKSRKATFIAALFEWLGWHPADVAFLIGAGGAATDNGVLDTSDYRSPELLIRINRAIRLLKALGASAVDADKWCEDRVDADAANSIRAAAMARHDEQSWLTVAKPLHDALRNSQRSALVHYLVARPEKWHPAGSSSRIDSSDLFAHFLIDVEMDACQLTSRIKSATGAIQLFGQRCLLGLEEVAVDDDKWLQWRWMKNFRVWEANRKVWLYPENWIEPELRDNKTPFFKDLEAELLQGEITDAAAEQAVLHYLEKVDEVGRLEISGVYQDDETRLLHVFGRTFNTPRLYFYRRARVIDGTPQRFSNWTPWEKVEIDIEGDHLIPVVRERRLTLLWPIFSLKQDSKQVEMPSPNEALPPGETYWEIQMAWSEYQGGGRWTAKNVSEAVELRAHQGSDNVLFGSRPKIRPELIGDTLEASSVVFLRKQVDEAAGSSETGGTGPGPRPGFSSADNAGPLPPVDKRLISFQADVDKSDGTVTVRAYLSLAYAATIRDEEVAAAFGVFRLTGCRKIVTSAPRMAISPRTLPLAPKGMRFSYMWFEKDAGGLRLLDGNLPAGPASGGLNLPGPLFAGQPTVAAVKSARKDIDVFASTPSPFRLLPPHQDRQFKGDRPFFFMDHEHTLLVTSSGSTTSGVGPDLTGWTAGKIGAVWRADFLGAPEPTRPERPGAEPRSVAILRRGAGGRRVVTEVVTPDVSPAVARTTSIPKFHTTRQYRFVPFQHPFSCELLSILDREQLRGLFSLLTQERTRDFFEVQYQPVAERMPGPDVPVDQIDFRYDDSYEAYNWELFFHIPLLIADRLTKNQRFEEAQRWYHFIFDPTGSSGGGAPQRYWRTLPFHRRLVTGPGLDSYEAQAVLNIEKALARGLPTDWLAAVDAWRANPFNPHAIARLRTTAYQKTVVMKYIDNLIAWGDQLFRRETLESLNEATQLYVLAAEILGRKPEVIERNQGRRIETFGSLNADSRLGPLSNAEQLVPDAGPSGSDSEAESPEPPSALSLYFCVPENGKLLGYWDTVADRLFKLRHCMDIEGRVRQLPLFEPPIDPALLVRAQAAGLSINDVVSELGEGPSNYRFAVMLQKANELAAEARNLAGALLSALEKRDAEALSLLRSGQEIRLLSAVRDIRVKQVEEAEANIAGLMASREAVEARRQFYEGRGFNALEKASLALQATALLTLFPSTLLRSAAAIMKSGGVAKIGAPTTAGYEFGLSDAGAGQETAATVLEVSSSLINQSSQLIGRLAEYDRRHEEWALQANLAAIELKQVDQQLAAAEIRLAIAERELANHDIQIEHSREADRFMREKFTNADLFGWLVGQTSGLYFQSYQIAVDLARRAARCLEFELGQPKGSSTVIRFGHWDSLRKGLTAADHLAHDLKRLELAHLETNVREFELTKHVSLATLDPLAFIALKELGRCEGVRIPESLFDLDTPGHYLRRLRSVSLTIPCITGPYTGIHCKLELTSNEIRRDQSISAGYAQTADDTRFIVDRRVVHQMVTSTGQNDGGLFEMNLHDERYLPFEGAGAVSTWSLELPGKFKSFDYNSISDVILHLRYTSRDGGKELKEAAEKATEDLIGGVTSGAPLRRLASLRHEFPSEWHRLISSVGATGSITVDLPIERFPYLVHDRKITIKRATVLARIKARSNVEIAVNPGLTALPPAPPVQEDGVGTLIATHRIATDAQELATQGPWTVSVSSPRAVEDLFLILYYSARARS